MIFYHKTDKEIENLSPDYLVEKFDTYIGIEKINKKLNTDNLSDSLLKWISLWGNNKNKVLTIFIFVHTLRGKELSLITEYFTHYTDIQIKSNEHKSEYTGLHPTLNNFIKKWLSTDSNKRHYKLINILY